jgi:hypothetical protein
MFEYLFQDFIFPEDYSLIGLARYVWNYPVYAFVIVFFIFNVFYLLYLFLRLIFVFHKNRRDDERYNEVYQLTEDYLTAYCGGVISEERTALELKVIARRHPKNIIVIAECMNDFMERISGNWDDKLMTLFRSSVLRPWVDNMIQKPWNPDCELATLLAEKNIYREVLTQIFNNATYPSKSLKLLSLRAIYVLSPQDFLPFIRQKNILLDDWEQLNLINIQDNKNFDLIKGTIFHLTGSDNEDHIVFGLKLISYYRFSHLANVVNRYLYHENERIKLNALDTCENLFLQELEVTLQDMILDPKNSLNVKRKCLDVLTRIGTIKSISFIKNYIHEIDPSLEFNCLRCLYKLDPHLDFDLLPQISEKTSSIINHLKEPLNAD